MPTAKKPATRAKPAAKPAKAPASPAPVAAAAVEIVITEDAIRAKAHELWLARGCREGFAAQDWADAHALLLAAARKKVQPKSGGQTSDGESAPRKLSRVA